MLMISERINMLHLLQAVLWNKCFMAYLEHMSENILQRDPFRTFFSYIAVHIRSEEAFVRIPDSA